MRKSLLTLVFMIALVSASPALAANTRVSGEQIPDLANVCTGTSLGTYTMEGGLVGCWYTDDYTVVSETKSGIVALRGHEHMVGCLDLGNDGVCDATDPDGTLSFSFQFSGKYDDVTFAEIRGRCEHRIVSGTDDFEDASGVITFKDDVSTGIASYAGNVLLPA